MKPKDYTVVKIEGEYYDFDDAYFGMRGDILIAWIEKTLDDIPNDRIHIISWEKVLSVPRGMNSAYRKSDDPEEDDSAELAAAVDLLRKKAVQGAWMFGKEGKFEVYSWNTCECIAPENANKTIT